MFQVFISVPALFLVSYHWFVPESPRWLLVMGQKERAITELEYMARKNGLPTDHIRSTVENELSKQAQTIQTATPEKKAGRISDLFSSPPMVLISMGMWINWFAVSMCYYGAAQYVGSIGANVYINYAITALIQIPGTLILLVGFEHLGRKWSMVAANLIPAIGFLAVYWMPSSTLQIVCAALAMFGLAMGFPGCYVYSGELFPTVVRNVGIGSSSMMGRVGAILAAIIADLKVYCGWLPSVIFSLCMGLAALMCLFLPETKGRKLPDTVQDVNESGRKKPEVV